MNRARNLPVVLAVFVALACLSLGSAGPAAASGRNEYIEVVIKESDGCSATGGKFDGTYMGREIDVRFSFTSGVNVKALEIKQFGKEVKDVKSIVCPPPGEKKLPITGRKLKIEGLWRSWESFIAEEIYLSD